MMAPHRPPSTVAIAVDPHPPEADLRALWLAAWNDPEPPDFRRILARSLAHLGAYEAGQLIGYVNIAGDGGIHAFILDTCVHPHRRRRGIATALVTHAATVARERGAHWLHVDFEPHLRDFHRRCGFRSTEAGLIRLA